MRLLTLAVVLVAAIVLRCDLLGAGQDRGVAVQTDNRPGRRVALVLGDDAYARQPLRNAVADAKAMAAALKQYGFDVELALDTTYKDLNKHIDRFTSHLQPGDVAMVYYAGHGIQIEGENYLVPVDFSAQEEADVKYEAYPASRVVDRLGASGARLSIIVLDACRDNPFRSSRSGSRGLAAMETGKGTLVAFATAPNRTADDNPRGSNGLFTGYLLEAMKEPGLSVELVFSRARQKVYEASNGRQVPWLVSSVIGDFFFRPPSPSSAASTEEERLWASIADSESSNDFQRYIDKYPAGKYTRVAKLYILGLKNAEAAKPGGNTSARPDDTRVPPAVGAAPPRANSTVNAALRTWQPYFVQAQGGNTYVPFTMPLDSATARTGEVAMYIRVARKGSSPGAAYAYEDFRTLPVHRGDSEQPASVAGSFAVPEGEYIASVAVIPRDPRNPPKDRKREIQNAVAMIDSGAPGVLVRNISVPGFNTGGFRLSSLFLSSRLEATPGAVTPAEQAVQPFRLAGMTFQPLDPARFSTRDEMNIVIFIYGAKMSPAGKPDVKVDFEFWRSGSSGVDTFFNRTNPQILDASSLPAGFDGAVNALAAGQAVPVRPFAPGEYLLKVTVTDRMSGAQQAASARVIVY